MSGRQEAQDGRRLSRLVEAGTAILGAESLAALAGAVAEGITAVFDARGAVELSRGDQVLRAGPSTPSDDASISVPLPPSAHGIAGTLELHGPYREDGASERSLLDHLALLTVKSADRLFGLAEAREDAQDRRDIMAVVSHDVRTPLQTFSMGVESIEASTKQLSAGDPATRDATAQQLAATLGRMRRSVAAMSALLADLLDVDAIQDGVLPIDPGRHEVAPILEELRARHAPAAEKRGVVLTTDVEPQLALVCDAQRLALALGKLVTSAVLHTRQGTITLRARAVDGSRARFEVTDTGTGARRPQRPRVSDRLFESPQPERAERFDLDMYIVQGIALAHGGRAGTDLPTDRGMVSWIELPLAAVSSRAP